MNHITDLRLADFPTMVLLLKGNSEVVVHITAPTYDLIGELERSKVVLESILNGDKTERTQQALYDLAAKLINCNDDDFHVTGHELLVDYRWSIKAVGKFFEDYRSFIESIENEKN